jgi:4'-phosphopantetheinyl transferase
VNSPFLQSGYRALPRRQYLSGPGSQRRRLGRIVHFHLGMDSRADFRTKVNTICTEADDLLCPPRCHGEFHHVNNGKEVLITDVNAVTKRFRTLTLAIRSGGIRHGRLRPALKQFAQQVTTGVGQRCPIQSVKVLENLPIKVGQYLTQEPSTVPIHLQVDEILWRQAPKVLASPAPRTIHIWRCQLDELAGCERELARLLSDVEKQRANRFRFDGVREQFVMARGALRAILGRYLGVPPNSVMFEYSEHGKPQLNDAAQHKICFNVAHSHKTCLIGVTCSQRIGVDVEWVRDDIDVEGFQRLVFSSGEAALLQHTDPKARAHFFFILWCRKEALLKGLGEGLLNTPKLWDTQECNWTFLNLQPYPGYVAAAAAIERGLDRTEFWNWTAADVLF